MKGLIFQAVVLVLAAVLAGLALCIALGFLFAALCIYLTHFMSLTLATAATAAIAIVIALLILLIAKMLVSRRTRKAESSAAVLGALLGEDLKAIKGFGTTKRLLVALVAGIAVGLSPRLRRILFELF